MVQSETACWVPGGEGNGGLLFHFSRSFVLTSICFSSPGLFLYLTQHLQEQLDLDLSPLEYMMKCYPEIKEKEEMRKIIGRYGLTGKQQVGLAKGTEQGALGTC